MTVLSKESADPVIMCNLGGSWALLLVRETQLRWVLDTLDKENK